jgi:8-oxo-dGTP diphosphatase
MKKHLNKNKIMEKTIYVCGFCFNNEKTKVVLIWKERPIWQKGKLNGVGGHVETTDQSIYTAMQREFLEETGLDINQWLLFTTYCAEEYIVYFMKTFTDKIDDVKTITDEKIYVCDINQLDFEKKIPNLKWLIPLALDPLVIDSVVNVND